MSRIYLVRHGCPEAAWSASSDPGLDAHGKEQARAVAAQLTEIFAHPVSLLTSPLKRCRETAGPLAEAWGVAPVIAPEVAEIPSPADVDRAAWLRQVFGMRWPDFLADEALSGAADFGLWRKGILARLAACGEDSVVFTHFVAINVAVGAAQGDDRIFCARPAHVSVWVFETGGRLLLRERGREMESRIA